MITDGQMKGVFIAAALVIVGTILGAVMALDKWASNPANSGLCDAWTDMRDRQAKAIKTCNAEPRCSVTPDDLVKLTGYEDSVIRTCAGFER